MRFFFLSGGTRHVASRHGSQESEVSLATGGGGFFEL
jgi:hypothetical protein